MMPGADVALPLTVLAFAEDVVVVAEPAVVVAVVAVDYDSYEYVMC